MAARGAEHRERLELEDFGGGDEAFDPVLWLNSRLASSSVSFDKLDQHLSSLGMSCQLLCQDTSEAIEVASNQLVAQLVPSMRDLERMRQEALRGKARLGDVLDGLKDADDKKRSGLQGLAEIDVVKSRVEVACSALREVGSWERKVRDCEQMVHSGNLPEALKQSNSLKGVLEAFRMLPEYAKKEEQLVQLEEQLLNSARRRARGAVERNAPDELRACREVFAGMDRHQEAASIANGVFLELSDRAWNSQDPKAGASAAELANAAKAVFDSLAQALEERGPLLQALEQPQTVGEEATEDPATPSASSASAPPVTVVAVKAALAGLSTKLESYLAHDGKVEDETTVHNKASRAVALLAVYADGFQALAASTPLGHQWLEVCKDSSEKEVLPWALLREVVRFVLLRPMQDDAMALAPPTSGQLRPSEAVLAAESNATRLLQMPSTWARRVEQQGAEQLCVPWLACVDEAIAAHWRQWDRLIETFHNTLQSKSREASDDLPAKGYDPALLQECMQLHSILHESLQAKFQSFQAETLQHVGQMRTSQSAIGHALKEKLKDPEVWCEKLALPSVIALKSAADLMDSSVPGNSRVLPSSAAALANAEKQVRSLVTQCCAQPVTIILRGYPEMQEWVRGDDDASAEALAMAGGMPLQAITLVGEHLFSLVPQLERSQDSSQLQWLPTILEAVVDAAVQKVVEIKQLTITGSRQLAVDLAYLQKVTDALGSSGGDGKDASVLTAGARLQEVLEALEFLAVQQQKKKEYAAKGENFTEALREGPALSRWAERPLRAAMGL